MTKGNDLSGFFSGHDPCKTRHAQYIAFFGKALGDEIQRFRQHANPAFCHSDAIGVLFLRNINHMGVSAAVKMGEFGHPGLPWIR